MFRRENHVYMIAFVASFRIKVGTISKLSDVMRVQMSSNIHIDRTGQNRTGQYYGETSQTTATTTTTTTTTATTATTKTKTKTKTKTLFSSKASRRLSPA